uniref:Cytospin-A n=1 Tax=Anthurium amnicola TaxID=1678845 RepID=A0A1D1YWD6_9ARAE
MLLLLVPHQLVSVTKNGPLPSSSSPKSQNPFVLQIRISPLVSSSRRHPQQICHLGKAPMAPSPVRMPPSPSIGRRHVFFTNPGFVFSSFACFFAPFDPVHARVPPSAHLLPASAPSSPAPTHPSPSVHSVELYASPFVSPLTTHACSSDPHLLYLSLYFFPHHMRLCFRPLPPPPLPLFIFILFIPFSP